MKTPLALSLALSFAPLFVACSENPDQASHLLGTWESGSTTYQFDRDGRYSVSADGVTVSGVYEAGYDNLRLVGRQRYTTDCDGPITNLYEPVSCSYEEADYYERYEGNILRLYSDRGEVSTLSFYADGEVFAPGAFVVNDAEKNFGQHLGFWVEDETEAGVTSWQRFDLTDRQVFPDGEGDPAWNFLRAYEVAAGEMIYGETPHAEEGRWGETGNQSAIFEFDDRSLQLAEVGDDAFAARVFRRR